MTASTKTIALVWFHRDLRLRDNPALQAAMAACSQPEDILVPFYIHDPDAYGSVPPGGATQWWLHHALNHLNASLQEKNSELLLFAGNTLTILHTLLSAYTSAGEVTLFFNRGYEPARIALSKTVMQLFARNAKPQEANSQEEGEASQETSANTTSDTEAYALPKGLNPAACIKVNVQHFQANLLFEPWQVSNQQGKPYQVFSAFWKACVQRGLPSQTHEKQHQLPGFPEQLPKDIEAIKASLEALRLLPKINWDGGFYDTWKPSEDEGLKRLRHFLEHHAADYNDTRNLPSVDGTSRLSPYLHFGQISPRQIVAMTQQVCETHNERPPQSHLKKQNGYETFIKEVGWREFAHHLIYHFPHTVDEPLREEFAHFPWEDNAHHLNQWQKGLTGYPIVDAGMRELWHMGWMHNRVRMIVASFLVKHLMIPWQEGAHWFWDTLVDADLANNTLGWQWTAGCGADAAPYFRIFNPILQGKKFDAEGEYIRRWVPELKPLSNKWIHEPWAAPHAILQQAGVTLGSTYPKPLVDHFEARDKALAAFKELRQ